MPKLFFNVRTDKPKFRLGFGQEAYAIGSSCISTSVVLLGDESVELETGENFRSLIGELKLFKESDFIEAHKQGIAGHLTYFEAGEDLDYGKHWSVGYALEGYMPDADFNIAISMMSMGVNIKFVAINTPLQNEYFQYGAAPDGSVIEWKNITRRYIELNGFSVTFEQT